MSEHQPPAYPLARPEDDPRFTFGLAYDVAKVLVGHGFPSLNGDDLVRLQQGLFRFVYTQPGEQPAATPEESPRV